MCYHNVEIAAIETLVSHSQISTLSKELSFSKIWESHSRSRLSIFQRILSFSFSTLKNLPEKSHSQSRLSRIFASVLILDLDSQSSYSRRRLNSVRLLKYTSFHWWSKNSWTWPPSPPLSAPFGVDVDILTRAIKLHHNLVTFTHWERVVTV